MKNLKKEIRNVIQQNDLIIIDRSRTGDIRTISTEQLTKDLVNLVKELKLK